MTENTAQSVARDLMPAAPPVGVAGATYMGIPLAEWLLILTIVYTVVQIIIALPKMVAVVRSWFKK